MSASQVSILYIIDLLFNVTFLFDTVLFNFSKEIKLIAQNLVSFPGSYGAWHVLEQKLTWVSLVKIFHKILQDLTRFHKVPFQNLVNCKIP